MLVLPLLSCLSLSSCSTVAKARQDLKTMSPEDFQALRTKVYAITAIASHRVSVDWDIGKKAKAVIVIRRGSTLISNNKAEELSTLDATSLIRTLAQKYGEQLGLSDKAKMDIQDAALLVDMIVGPIKLEMDGTLDERSKQLILALLQGLEAGLQ